MKPTTLILVGGFLGAGKTTLLWRAAQHLMRSGKRVGLITNDQAPMLVDTGLLRWAGLTVDEIAGGCFCCRFDQLVEASERLIDRLHPDVLIGEPVGSCTDLSATVLQPLKDRYADRFRIAPFSVLVDPRRLREALDPDAPASLHPSALYILRTQLEEADRILINKADLTTPGEMAALRNHTAARFPSCPTQALSALHGTGVAEWLKSTLAGGLAGQRIAEVDYNVYAEGEALLGWLNATLRVAAAEPTDWVEFCRSLLESIREALRRRGAGIAHLKLLLAAPAGQCAANLTHSDGTVAIQGALAAEAREAELTLNARVELPPAELRAIVMDRLQAATAGRLSAFLVRIEHLSPGRPRPTHRYAGVVPEIAGDEIG
ncbi:MAG: cobalamin synthesis protein P47K [Armatimonadetes bacterium]|nr:cobalamin synthesis protein P47K [Armatimonadota bacterium]